MESTTINITSNSAGSYTFFESWRLPNSDYSQYDEIAKVHYLLANSGYSPNPHFIDKVMRLYAIPASDEAAIHSYLNDHGKVVDFLTKAHEIILKETKCGKLILELFRDPESPSSLHLMLMLPLKYEKGMISSLIPRIESAVHGYNEVAGNLTIDIKPV